MSNTDNREEFEAVFVVGGLIEESWWPAYEQYCYVDNTDEVCFHGRLQSKWEGYQAATANQAEKVAEWQAVVESIVNVLHRWAGDESKDAETLKAIDGIIIRQRTHADELSKLLAEAKQEERETILNEYEWFKGEGKWLADAIRTQAKQND